MSDEKTPTTAPSAANLAGRDLSQNNIGALSMGPGSTVNLHSAPAPLPLPTIGIRSYTRAAKKLPHETVDICDVLDYFDDRRPKSDKSYEAAAAKIIEFFQDPRRAHDLRRQEHALHLECLLSLAFTAGYEASRNSGMRLYPIQKPDMVVWKPAPSNRKVAGRWRATAHLRDKRARDVAVGVSVVKSVLRDVTSYLDLPGAPGVQALVELQPCPPASDEPQMGNDAIVDADHAYQLASALKAEIDRLRPDGGCVHVFATGPVALMFFLGQLRDGLGLVQLYEHDFETSVYRPSLRFNAGRLVPAAI